jgi:hypothetical protein
MAQNTYTRVSKCKNDKIKKEEKKMWYIYTMEYYSATKKNEIMLFVGKWMELENIMLSKVSQAQEVKGLMFSSYVEARLINAHISTYIYKERGERWSKRERVSLRGLQRGRRGKENVRE